MKAFYNNAIVPAAKGIGNFIKSLVVGIGNMIVAIGKGLASCIKGIFGIKPQNNANSR